MKDILIPRKQNIATNMATSESHDALAFKVSLDEFEARKTKNDLLASSKTSINKAVRKALSIIKEIKLEENELVISAKADSPNKPWFKNRELPALKKSHFKNSVISQKTQAALQAIGRETSVHRSISL